MSDFKWNHPQQQSFILDFVYEIREWMHFIKSKDNFMFFFAVVECTIICHMVCCLCCLIIKCSILWWIDILERILYWLECHFSLKFIKKFTEPSQEILRQILNGFHHILSYFKQSFSRNNSDLNYISTNFSEFITGFIKILMKYIENQLKFIERPYS
jgi:hypothetical protein